MAGAEKAGPMSATPHLPSEAMYQELRRVFPGPTTKTVGEPPRSRAMAGTFVDRLGSVRQPAVWVTVALSVALVVVHAESQMYGAVHDATRQAMGPTQASS